MYFVKSVSEMLRTSFFFPYDLLQENPYTNNEDASVHISLCFMGVAQCPYKLKR